MSDIVYTDVDTQIQKLKSQNLIIPDEEYAKVYLSTIGYSNLIKSYREPYVIESNGEKIFRSEIAFNQICSLYVLDKNLRIAVMASMLDLEEHIKEITADVVAKSFGVHQDDYLRYKNYRNKRKRKERFSLSGVLRTMRETLDTDKEPIHHYREKYGAVPPWILFKSIYFSTIINYIDQLKLKEQALIANRIYPSNLKYSDEDKIKMMMDTLFICLEYRNTAAHGGRIYNYSTKRNLRFSDSARFSAPGFSMLLRLLNALAYHGPYDYLDNVLNRELNRHCGAYPQDMTYLAQVLNINIIPHKIVWINSKSHKYHRNRYCSGMQDAKQVDLEYAEKLGFTKCKRCCE